MAELTHIDLTEAKQALTMEEWERVAQTVRPRMAALRAAQMAGTFYGPEGRAPEYDRCMREMRSAYIASGDVRAAVEFQQQADRRLALHGEVPVDWRPTDGDAALARNPSVDGSSV